MKDLGFKHLDHLHTYCNKKLQLERLKNEKDFFPRSTRLKFEFYVPDRVREDQDFKELEEETNKVLLDAKTAIKNHIITHLDIETKLLRTIVQEH